MVIFVIWFFDRYDSYTIWCVGGTAGYSWEGFATSFAGLGKFGRRVCLREKG